MSWHEKRLITVLSVIMAILFAAVLIVLSGRYRAAQAAKEDPAQFGDESAATQIDYVNLSYQNGSAYLAFALDQAGAWYWENEPDFPLDDGTVQTILTLLRALEPQQTLDRPEDLSECGLDSPHVTLTATAPDGAMLTINMGNATTDGESYYADINGDPDHIYIISGTLYQAMQTPIYDMCVLPELPAMTEDLIASIVIRGPRMTETSDAEETADARTTTVLTAAHTEDGATSWRSGGANVTDVADVRALLEDLAALAVTKCVDYRPSDEAAAFCGFDDPSELTVYYKTATGAEQTFDMVIGSQNMDGTGRYVRFGEEAALYLMELSDLDPLMRLAYQGME